MKRNAIVILLLLVTVSAAPAREFYVSVNGNDQHDGSAAQPLRTISAAAKLAQPGDRIFGAFRCRSVSGLRIWANAGAENRFKWR